MAEEYGLEVEIEKNLAQALVEVLHFDSQIELFYLTCSKKFRITTSN